MAVRCIMCGRMFEPDEGGVNTGSFWEEDDKPKKSPVFCQICEAKLKHEADQAQKNPKPM